MNTYTFTIKLDYPITGCKYQEHVGGTIRESSYGRAVIQAGQIIDQLCQRAHADGYRVAGCDLHLAQREK